MRAEGTWEGMGKRGKVGLKVSKDILKVLGYFPKPTLLLRTLLLHAYFQLGACSVSVIFRVLQHQVVLLRTTPRNATLFQRDFSSMVLSPQLSSVIGFVVVSENASALE